MLASCGDRLADIRALHATGRYAQSIEPLRELLDEDRDDPELQYLYGLALLRNGQPDLAQWPLRRAIESPDWAVRAGLVLGQAAFAAKNWEGAIEASSQVLALEPDRLDAITLRGQARLEQKTSGELALEDFERALELAPGDRELRVSKALTLIHLERVDEAAEVFEELAAEAKLKLNPTEADIRACATFATFTKERGEIEAAGPLYDECLEIFPTSTVILQEAIQYYDQQGKPRRSLEILQNALALDPGLAVQRDELARRLSAAGLTEEAQQVLREGTEVQDPAAAAYAWSVLADHHRGREEYGEAADAFGKALALEGNPGADRLLVYADLLGIAGRHDQAMDVAQSLQEPIYVDLVQARRFAMQDDPRRALEHLESVLLRWPNNGGARYQAARAAEQLGDFDRAIEEYRQSIRAAAEKTDAGLRLGRIYERMGRVEPGLVAVNQYLAEFRVDTPGIRVGIRLASIGTDANQLKAIFRHAVSNGLLPEAIAARAEWLTDAQNPADAITLIETSELDLTHTRNAEVIQALVAALASNGRADAGIEAAESALDANPESAVLHGVRGFALAAGGQNSKAETAYQRALELDPELPLALVGLAELAQAQGETSESAEWYGLALETGRLDQAEMRAAAAALAAAGQQSAAADALDSLLDEYPHDALAALRRAEQHLAQEPPETERARRLAGIALRFGAGAPAQNVLDRIEPDDDR